MRTSTPGTTPPTGFGAEFATWRTVFRSWGLLLTTVFTVLALAGQLVQSVHDYYNLEERTAIRVGNVADLTRDLIQGELVAIRQLFGVMDLAMEGDGGGADAISLPSKERVLELRALYQSSIPGLELLVVDEHRHFIVESDTALRNSTPAIVRVVEKLQAEDAPAIAVDPTANLQGPCFLVGKAHLDRQGRRRAFVIAVVPANGVTHQLARLELGPWPLISLQDASGELLARYPDLPNAILGKKLPVAQGAQVGPRPGSYYEQSPLDGVSRLTVERDVALPNNERHWTLKVGYAGRDYRQGWYVSTGINIAVCSILVLAWVVTLLSRWQEVKLLQQIDASRKTVEHLLADLPMPFMLVAQSDHRIVRGNDALAKIFGAMASPGSRAARLFSNDEDLTTVMSAGARDTVGMMTRHGEAYMLVSCTEASGLAPESGPCWLFTLVDVTEQYIQQKQLQSEATTDPLTGLANRRSFSMASELEIARARKQQTPLAILSLDLDHFKRVNDQYGHGTGDLVLVQAARLLKSAMRDGDLASRVGGEEFVALLPNTAFPHAMAAAERIRQSIATTPVVLPDGTSLSVTTSIGVAMFWDKEFDLSPALERADQALYRAKEGGRNRVEPEYDGDLSDHPSGAS